MLQALLNKFWRQHPIKQQLHGHLLPITKTIQVRRTMVFTRARSGRVTQRCHNRNPRWETGLGSGTDVTHRKRAEDLGDFASGEDGWLSLARRSQASGLVAGATRVVGGGRWKSQHRKIVHLSSLCQNL